MITRSPLICQRGRTVMRNAGPPDFTDNLKESGAFDPYKVASFGGLVGRLSHTSARSAGIAQRATTDNNRHIKHLLVGYTAAEIALNEYMTDREHGPLDRLRSA